MPGSCATANSHLQTFTLYQHKSAPFPHVLAGRKIFSGPKGKGGRKQTAQNIANGRKKLPEPKSLDDKQIYMVDEILNVCGDEENRIAYEKAVRENPENLIWTVISETKLASHERRIKKNKGADFMDTLKRIAEMRANTK